MKLFKRIGLFLLFGMVLFYISFSLFKGTRSLSDVPANEAFDDINFYKCVVDAYNKDNKESVSYDTNLSDEQLNKINNLRCYDRNIISTKGIEKIVSLERVNLAKNKIEDINLSNNILLGSLVIDTNKLTKLDVSNNTKLYELKVSDNLLTELNVSKNIELTELDIGYWSSTSNYGASGSGKGNLITEIDVSKNINLKRLYLNNNKLTKIDLSENVELDTLYLEKNQLTKIDLSKNVELDTLYLEKNQLTELDVSKNTKLIKLLLSSNKLSELDVSKNTLLTTLEVGNGYGGNYLTKLDVSKNIKLTELSASYNQLTELDLSKNTMLTKLNVNNNKIQELDVSKNVKLIELSASKNLLTYLDLNNNVVLTYLFLFDNQLINLKIDGAIALEELYVSKNELTNLDVSKNIDLFLLYADNNRLTNINLKKNIALTKLLISGNEFQNLDLSNNVNLIELSVGGWCSWTTSCGGNLLSALDISKNTKLKTLTADNNQLVELNVENNLELVTLTVDNNKLIKLDLRKNTNLKKININNNNFNDNVYVYVVNNFELNNAVKLPEQLNFDEPIWFSKNTSIVRVDESGNGKAIKSGVGIIVGNVDAKYTTTSTVNVVEITSDNYSINNINHMIVVDLESVSYEEFISNIDIPDNINIKIFDGENEIKSGNISLGMKLKVYHNDEVLNVFDITGEYLKFDADLIIKDEYISNISVGTSVSDLVQLIDTNGSISVYDKNGNIIIGDKLISTGSIVKIVMNNKTIEYNLSVNGDVDGDGKLMLSDIMKISKYVYVDKKSLSDVYLLAADYNMDNNYNLQDIMKIASKIYKGGN